MSTKPIREALEILKHEANNRPSSVSDAMENEVMMDAYAAALEAVRAIEEMARKILDSGRLVGAQMNEERLALESIAEEAP